MPFETDNDFSFEDLTDKCIKITESSISLLEEEEYFTKQQFNKLAELSARMHAMIRNTPVLKDHALKIVK